MTAHTGEFPTMANGTGCALRAKSAFGMGVEEGFACVADRFERSRPHVAVLATPGNLDLYMTDQAVRHIRHGGGGHLVRLLETAMARLTRVRGVEMTSDAG